MSYILLTRPKRESLKMKRIFRKLGFKVFIESMFKIHYISPKINVKKFDIIVSSSKNSIISLARIIRKCDSLIIAVGDGTMRVARSMGFRNVISLSGTVNDIISYIKTNYSYDIRVLYIRGEKITCDLKKLMLENGFFNFEDEVVYRSVIRERLSRDCYELLKTHKKLKIFIYSSLTAEIFVGLINKYKLVNSLHEAEAYVISNKVANVVCPVFKDVFIANIPTTESMLSLIYG